ncbi:MAG: hypothetical protein WAL95_15535 [Candidatus Acidiferrales bacterium]
MTCNSHVCASAREPKGSEKEWHFGPPEAAEGDGSWCGWKLLMAGCIVQTEKNRLPSVAPGDSIQRCDGLATGLLNSTNTE